MTDDSVTEEERVGALMRRSDGRMVIRPLRRGAVGGRSRSVQVFSALAFTAVMIVSAALGAGVINSLRQPVASPAPSNPAAATVGLPASPAAPSSGPATPGFATAQGAADAAKEALERRDFQLLTRLVAPSGWFARWYEQTQTDPMTFGDAVGWISSNPKATWRVDASEVRDAGPARPVGEKYVPALALEFHGWAEQRADIMLGSVGGRWFWSSLLLYRPPPLGASADTFVGYARLTNVTDATITVRFRTVGSMCCSDQSWNDRVVVLRRDDRTIYNKAGGVSASSLTDGEMAVGSDVWVQFRFDTLGPDGSYRLAWVVAMYPQR